MNITTKATSADWVDQLIGYWSVVSSTGKIEFTVNGVTIQTSIAKDFVTFFITNKTVLYNMGKDVFKDFLALISEKKEEAAFDLLVKSMSADDIIARMNMNAASLDAYNKDKDKFYASVKNFLISTVAPDVIKVLIGLL